MRFIVTKMTASMEPINTIIVPEISFVVKWMDENVFILIEPPLVAREAFTINEIGIYINRSVELYSIDMELLTQGGQQTIRVQQQVQAVVDISDQNMGVQQGRQGQAFLL